MSRSRKKTPICGITTAESEKDDKARAHRQERSHVRRLIETDPDAIPAPKTFGDPWGAAKDGKQYFRPPPETAAQIGLETRKKPPPPANRRRGLAFFSGRAIRSAS